MNTNVEDLQTIALPLKKLLAWDNNVRTTAPEEGIEELAASIISVGLLQSLVVKKATRGKYAVIAGKRRLLALSQLAQAGALPANFEVPCRLMAQTADATEISLAENVQREPMHPADEFEPFQKLIANGRSVADVAARFGVSEAVVNRRLALARVSPMLLKQYRLGEINLELLQAFTLTDDHVAQEQIWEHLQPLDRNPSTIRRLLSKNDIPATDKRVRFVGLSNYEAAGGFVKRDLFHDNERGVYVTEAAKLNRLVNERLETIAGQLKADGWKCVDVQPEPDYQFLGRHKRLQAREIHLSPELEAETEALEKEYEALNEQLSEEEDDTPTGGNERIYERIDEIENRLQEIRRNGNTSMPTT